MMETHILDNVTLQFISALNADASMIQQAATSLFYYLAVIQVALTALVLAISGQSLERTFIKLLQVFVTLGIFYALIQHANEWVPSILNGFIEVGEVGGITSLNPSSIIDQGASISGAILKGLYNTGLIRHPFVSIIGASVCISIIIIYAFIAAELTILLVKSYVLVAIGSLFFAFGGLSATSDMTRHYLKSVIGLGLKLMTLYLLLGVGKMIGADWAATTESAAKHHQIIPMLIILSAVIVYYMIVKNIPAFVAGLSGVGGFHNYGDAAIATSISAGRSGANTLLQAKQLTASTARSGAQAVQTAGQLGIGASTVFRQRGHSASSAAFNTLNGMAGRQQSTKTAGQKFKHKLHNRVRRTPHGKN